MPSLLCVPITVDDIDAALLDAQLAKAKGADLVELRIDSYFPGSEGDTEDAYRVAKLQRLLAECPLPVILTCRSASEGGDYDGDDADRVSLLEKLTAACDTPPAYLDFELAAYTRSANIRQKVNLCVQHPKQTRDIPTRLILSMHDFDGVPADLHRRLLAAYDEPACAVAKVAVRARSLRDNLGLFEILQTAPKPTIALGMGEFGLMSRVLAPKFGGFLTFASLRDASATAPGQPTIDDLLGKFRFRSITRSTKVYGVIGWPVSQSLGPLIHNAGFAEVGHDGVYLPLPIAADENDAEATYTSFKATVGALLDAPGLHFGGASVTIPHKEHLVRLARAEGWTVPRDVERAGAANTLTRNAAAWSVRNTDAPALIELVRDRLGSLDGKRIGLIGAGGVCRAVAAPFVEAGATVIIYNRTAARAQALADEVNAARDTARDAKAVAAPLDLLPKACGHAFINGTPIGMKNGPDPAGMSIPVQDMRNIAEGTVFVDTVYNPRRTPMLRAAHALGYPTVAGVEMFVKQAAIQFESWTGTPAPVELFARLCRAGLAE